MTLQPITPEIMEALRSLVITKLAPEMEGKLGEEDLLFHGGILNSIQIVDLVLALEQLFNIKIHPSDLTEDNFKTLQAIATFVSSKKEKENSR